MYRADRIRYEGNRAYRASDCNVERKVSFPIMSYWHQAVTVFVVHRYDPLCEHLKDAKEQKEGLVNTLEKCVTESKRVSHILWMTLITFDQLHYFYLQIMGDTKSTIQTRRIEDTKLNRKMSSLELEVLRGYNMRSETTFHQTKSSPSEEEQKSKESAKLFRARLNADRIRSSMDKSFSAKSLPPLKDSKSGTMPRNKSSML